MRTSVAVFGQLPTQASNMRQKRCYSTQVQSHLQQQQQNRTEVQGCADFTAACIKDVDLFVKGNASVELIGSGTPAVWSLVLHTPVKTNKIIARTKRQGKVSVIYTRAGGERERGRERKRKRGGEGEGGRERKIEREGERERGREREAHIHTHIHTHTHKREGRESVRVKWKRGEKINLVCGGAVGQSGACLNVEEG